ncbi:hypothetical protein [Streptomyces coeruleorubidus]|uniref:hypothetical protein n=1 Tax=Streptomyces coeruleorubidus TaxID=116188 RepID=UPI0033D8F303
MQRRLRLVRTVERALRALREIRGVAAAARMGKEGAKFAAFDTLLRDTNAFSDPDKLTACLDCGGEVAVWVYRPHVLDC